ncbi:MULTISPECIES: creatininase family protein [Cohnella]|uniref:creatininase family protein n=1 Tax=Cohnella TaxID=329857 RepID=UPI0009B9779F|nr:MULTISPECIES: creatininase family protein [Cohnella]MBN2981865.1 creatininase family protein [Cohnella algarum]
MEWTKMTAETAEAALARHPVALLPMGAVEAHGAHLPLGTDNLLAEGVARMVAERLDHALILPTIGYGQVWSLRDFPGTLSVSNEVLIGLIADIGRSLYRQGVKVLAIINGHVGNQVAMKEAARVLYEECPLKVLYLTYPGVGGVISEVIESERAHPSYFHACEIETSYMLYVAPEQVDMAKAVNDPPTFPPEFEVMNVPWREVTRTGVLGDATLATAAKGKAIIDKAVDNIVALIRKVEGDL